MKKDIILAGVGGQGILTIATIIGDAAAAAGVNLKQAEVHGMSQRGGDVQSNLRLSTEAIHSDLIKQGSADIIISMEPMEALPNVAVMPIEDLAKQNNMPKSANVVLLGMAAGYIEILSPEQLRESIKRLFSSKGESIVEMNCKAFDLGLSAVK